VTAPESVQSRQARPHWPALDGWRGFTIWFAISVHAGYFTAGGVLSLDTFFVLSGFLITGLLLREWDRSDGIALGSFWARRARRLLPALFVVLTAVLVYAAVLAPSLGLDKLRGDILGSLGYVVNWHFIWSGQSYFSSFTTPSPVLHLWSLAVEEQFYLLWPPIVLGVLVLCRRRMSSIASYLTVGVVAFLGSIVSAVWMVHLYTPGGDPSRVYYGTDTRAQAMLMGAVLSVVVLVHGPLRSRAARAALTVASPLCLLFVVAPWFAGDATWIHDFFYGRYGLLLYSVATCVVLWRLVQPSNGLLGTGLSWGPVRWVGGISYEMYLWHWPTYLVLTSDRTGLSGGTLFGVRIVTVVLLAWATHVLVDEPIRKGVRLRSPRLARVATAATVIALGVGVFGATVGAQPALSGQLGQLADASAPPTVPDRVSRPDPSQPSLVPGTTGTTTPPGPVKLLVVGDSQAATLAQGVQAAPGVYGLSHLPGYSVWNRAILGCPIISAPTFRFDGNDITNKCGGAGYWQQQWADDVGQFAPDAVVVTAGAWDVFDVVQPDGSILHPGDPAWVTRYSDDVRQLFRTLDANGAAVVAVKPPCWGESTLVGTDQQIAERMDPARVGAVADVWKTVAREQGVSLLDLDAMLCPQGTADPAIRPDGAHFSGQGADVAAEPVAKAVERAIAAHAAVRGLGATP
jgi:peptidoglycan/LPS O-acetylase OafA/YrhL/lysophospholipase L1-like esterase